MFSFIWVANTLEKVEIKLILIHSAWGEKHVTDFEELRIYFYFFDLCSKKGNENKKDIESFCW